MSKQIIEDAFSSFWNKLKSMPTDKDGLIIGGQKPYKFVCGSGPIDKGWVLRLGLPKALKIFAGSKYGTVKNPKTGDMEPLGLSFDNFNSAKEASQFLQLMLTDFETFVDTIIQGDGTRYYQQIFGRISVSGNPPYSVMLGNPPYSNTVCTSCGQTLPHKKAA